MYKIVISCFLLLTVNFALADDLAWVEKQLIAEKNISGHFVQKKMIAVLPQPLVSQGEYAFKQQDSQLVWHTKKPIDNFMLIDSEGISQLQAGKKTWLLKAGGSQFKTVEQLFSAFLQGDFELLKQHFGIRVLSQPDELPWRLQLLPLDASLAHIIQKIELTGFRKVDQILLYEEDNNKTLIELKP